jgi:energy-coupling factor transporter ATP-binding protein EcfA2
VLEFMSLVPLQRDKSLAEMTGLPGQSLPHPMLPIRSAERRRWTADLLRDDTTCLVLYGPSGIGKSTLARQVAQRVRRLRPDARLTVIDGFEPGTRDLAAVPGKLVITTRAPFTSKRRGTIFRRIGPLTRSGAGELASSLANLRGLSGTEVDRAWRLVAGHPQAMKDLDARLLEADFAELARQLSAAVTAVTGWTADRLEPTELPADVAETIAAVATAFLTTPRALTAPVAVPVPSARAARSKSALRHSAWRNLVLAGAIVATLVSVALVAPHPGAVSYPSALARASATSTRSQSAAIRAARWLASQVGPGTLVGCTPGDCAAVPRELASASAATILVTGAGSGSGLVTLARFGSIEIVLTSPGARQALAADQADRVRAGNQLLANSRLRLSALARRQVAGGDVDARLLITLAALLQRQPVTVSAFGDSGPGAAGDVPLRSATIVGAEGGMTDFFAAQPSPFRPQRLIATRGELVVQFDVATSFGLLEG